MPYWLYDKYQYPLLSKKAMEILIQFSTTYLYEKKNVFICHIYKDTVPVSARNK